MDEVALQAIVDLATDSPEPLGGAEPAPPRWNPRAVAALAVPVLLQTAVNIAAAAPVGAAGRSWLEWIEWLVVGTSAQLMLLATWMVLGAWPLARQCTLVGAALALLLATQAFALVVHSKSVQFNTSLLFACAELGVFASLAGVAWYFRRVRAWRLAPAGWPPSIPPGKPLRFSLRHLFIATAVVGAFLAIRTDRFPFQATIGGMIYGMLAAALFVPAMVLLLGTRRRRMISLVDGGLLLCAAAAVAWHYTWGAAGGLGLLWGWGFALAGSLVWMRICGIRLVRGPTARELRDPASN